VKSNHDSRKCAGFPAYDVKPPHRADRQVKVTSSADRSATEMFSMKIPLVSPSNFDTTRGRNKAREIVDAGGAARVEIPEIDHVTFGAKVDDVVDAVVTAYGKFIPLERVRPRAADQRIGAQVTLEHVVAISADQSISSFTAKKDIVAPLAFDVAFDWPRSAFGSAVASTSKIETSWRRAPPNHLNRC